MGNTGTHDRARQDAIEILAALGKLVSSEVRVEILLRLTEGSALVCELARAAGLSQALVSHHLKKLCAGGLVVQIDEDMRFSLTPLVTLDTTAEPSLRITTEGAECRVRLAPRSASPSPQVIVPPANTVMPEGHRPA